MPHIESRPPPQKIYAHSKEYMPMANLYPKSAFLASGFFPLVVP
jgi:hypothetical protein